MKLTPKGMKNWRYENTRKDMIMMSRVWKNNNRMKKKLQVWNENFRHETKIQRVKKEPKEWKNFDRGWNAFLGYEIGFSLINSGYSYLSELISYLFGYEKIGCFFLMVAGCRLGWYPAGRDRWSGKGTMTGVSEYWFSGHFRQVFSTLMHYPALRLAPTCGSSWQVFINAGARLLCTSDGVCVIFYVQFSSVGAGMVLGGCFLPSFWDRIWAE